MGNVAPSGLRHPAAHDTASPAATAAFTEDRCTGSAPPEPSVRAPVRRAREYRRSRTLLTIRDALFVDVRCGGAVR